MPSANVSLSLSLSSTVAATKTSNIYMAARRTSLYPSPSAIPPIWLPHRPLYCLPFPKELLAIMFLYNAMTSVSRSLNCNAPVALLAIIHICSAWSRITLGAPSIWGAAMISYNCASIRSPLTTLYSIQDWSISVMTDDQRFPTNGWPGAGNWKSSWCQW